ncbi:hypothetical protein LIER_19232 [Lithospermum erythrorhizon]|uniref:J domain-containing protein n=1 Tax=Lithospermum erythrorhizon TaxID=34254 RepID=A0AAV3QGX1_LITER
MSSIYLLSSTASINLHAKSLQLEAPYSLRHLQVLVFTPYMNNSIHIIYHLRATLLHISMEQVGNALDSKFLLVNDICSVSARATTCAMQHLLGPGRSPFIDWFLVLQIDEDAETEDIKKQYRRLALQLHPDKNKHPKAEIAFKLVSEAYNCLSDSEKKAGFNLERSRAFCTQCHSPARIKVKATDTSSKRWMKTMYSVRRVKELKSRMMVEATTIEKCLRNAASASRRELPALGSKELPIFNPLDYSHHDYPHIGNDS